MNEPDDYLWDRTGADPEVERLEKLLAPLAHDPARKTLPEAPKVPEPANRPWRLVLLTALVAAAAAAALTLRPSPTVEVAVDASPGIDVAVYDPEGAWAVEVLDGAPSCDGEPRAVDFDLEVGRWLETDTVSRARLNVADIGVMDVDPDTRLRLLRSDDVEYRVELAQGRISAVVDAPPRLLVVETPAVTAVDMGCAYTLEVTDAGDSVLDVTSGWVWLEHPDRTSMVPQGARAISRRDTGPGTPSFRDAHPDLVEGLARIDMGGGDLAAVLENARPRDSLSLVHLLGRVDPAERAAVWSRLVELAPVRANLRDAALAGDHEALVKVLDDAMVTW